MKYILIGIAFCFGVSCYLGIGLFLLANAPIDIFEDVAMTGNTDDYWMVMVMWPIYLVVNMLIWCIEKIDKLMEE